MLDATLGLQVDNFSKNDSGISANLSLIFTVAKSPKIGIDLRPHCHLRPLRFEYIS